MSDAPTPSPASSTHPALAVTDAVSDPVGPDTARKPKNKVRSAWISFAGRIVAQLIGAAATVLLGIYVASAYARHVITPPPAAVITPSAAEVSPSAPPATPIARMRQGQGLSLAVLPFQDYTPAAASGHVADGLTEALTATLVRGGHVQVISRTSAMQYKDARAPLPTIAAALGVDLVIEGSVSRQGHRIRVTVQLIDARSDEHLWAQTYERTTRDLLALEAEVSTAVARELTAVLPRTSQGSAADATASVVPSRGAGWLFAAQEAR